MSPEELRERMRLGEDARTEFKDERCDSEALAAALVSFANSGGGDIILGVSDDGVVRGVSDPDPWIQRIDSVARQNVEPPLVRYEVEKHAIEGKTVLLLHVSRSPNRPHRTNRGTYYVRAGASRRIATPQELREIFQAQGDLHPDEIPVEDATLEEVDRPYLLTVYPELRDLPDRDLGIRLARLKFATTDGHLTRAGLLCFGKDPQRFLPYARTTGLRPRGTVTSEVFDDAQELGGTLEQQIRAAQRFIRQHLSRPERVLGEAPPPVDPPFEAVDEAIVNAVAHRDYARNAQIRLLVFDDRVEVVSPGRLLNTITLEEMRSGCHEVRNVRIFAHLARLRLAKDAACGVPNMIRLMRESGLPDPDLAPRGADFCVTFLRRRA